MIFFSFIYFLLTGASVSLAQTAYDDHKTQLSQQEKNNLVAFAEMYNCIRYFYPSKAVQSVNCNKLAIYGIRETQNCTSKRELINKLYEIFLPLCSELQIDSLYVSPENLPTLSKRGRRKFVHYGSGKIPYMSNMSGIMNLLYRLDRPYYTKIKPLTEKDSLYWYNDNAGDLFFAMPTAALAGKSSDYKIIKRKIDTIIINQANIKQREFFVNADLRSHRLASIIIAWGNFRHFYPYRDLIPIDWEKQLLQALQEAMSGDYVDFHFGLRKMLAPLNDGHLLVLMGGKKGLYGFTLTGRVPEISLKNINDTIVLKNDFSLFPKGTSIDSVNGIAVKEWLHMKKEYISASPQLKRLLATEELLTTYRYEIDTVFHLSLTTSNGEKKSIVLPVSDNDNYEADTSDFISKRDNIYIFNFKSTQANYKRLHKTFKSINKDSAAKGIIIDFRDARYIDYKFLGYLTDSVIYSASLKVPVIMYPKQEQMEYKISRFKVKPRKEKIAVPVVFLTDATVLSYGESVMGIVDHYKLGYIVGEPTAGINGDVASLSLPVHDVWRYTGMRVDKHDGSPLFCEGITPTHLVHSTVKEYRQGIDAQLQKAFEIINQHKAYSSSIQ